VTLRGQPARALRSLTVPVAVSGAAVAVGGLVSVSPRLAVGAAIVAGLVRVIESPLGRLVILVFGGLFTLQSSSSLTPPKLVYFGAAAAATALVLYQRRDRNAFTPFAATIAFVAFALCSAYVLGGNPAAAARDSVALALLAVCPLFAEDAARVGARRLQVTFVAAGLVATTSFAAEWLDRHRLYAVNIHFALASGALAAALFTYAASMALSASRRAVAWATLGATVLALVLLTGTRSGLVFLAALPILVALNRKSLVRGRVRRLAGGAVVLVTVLTIANAAGVINLRPALTRLASVTDVGREAVATQSFNERRTQHDIARQAFGSHPWFGVGLGHPFYWRDQTGGIQTTAILDTPLSTPAKIGLVGLAALGAALYALYRYIRFIGSHRTPAQKAAAAYVGIWVANLPLALPFDDKGFAFGLLFLMALMVAEQATGLGGVSDVR
jgi:O-antigen ligase